MKTFLLSRNVVIGSSFLVVILALLLLNMAVGSVSIPLSATWDILCGNDVAHESWRYILLYNRMPQALTAALSGAALSGAGLLLQTTFNNPLAGPSILGINSGASLGVAIVVLLAGGSITAGSYSLSGFVLLMVGALVGSFLIIGLLLFFSSLLKSNLMILIIGIMIGYLALSAISLLNFFATSEGVQAYVMWGMGNFSGVSVHDLPFYVSALVLGLLAALLFVKPLNALLLGERYATNLGVNLKLTRTLLLLVVGWLTSVTTAFCGPVAFIGLVVPHLTRLLFRTSNHNVLLPMTLLTGSIIALLCNLVCTLPGEHGLIPLNAVTPLVGTPVIIYVIIKQKKNLNLR